MDQTQPLLSQTQEGVLDHMISVRFCVYKPEGCCPRLCYCCCAEEIKDAAQIVVPDTTTVGEFLHIVTQMNNPKKEYSMAFINGYQLSNEDLLAPTIRSFEKFESPMIVVPKEACCLLI